MSEQAYVMAIPAEASLGSPIGGALGKLWKGASNREQVRRAVEDHSHRQPTAGPVGRPEIVTKEELLPETSVTEIPEAGTEVAQPLSNTANVAASPEAILFKDFLSGDDEAFTKLFKAHNQRIFAYCYKMLGSEEQAQDVAQEVWEKVIDLRKEPPLVENPVGFLMRITRNKCLDVIKLRKNNSSLSDLDDHQHPYEEEHESSDEEEIVLRALERLPDEQREVLVLNIYSGYRFDEIAGMLGKSPDAIWARASRGRAALRIMVLEAMSGKGLSNRYKDTGKSAKAAASPKKGKEEVA
ncbi:MAG TPA: sigma-70 family RNA polymerase sigma factor [Candidatus Kapabacteria bacterium]|nr:sigma-70 family RNA polymerase sigma factor [Candidatus Kapabacteria bacterium]